MAVAFELITAMFTGTFVPVTSVLHVFELVDDWAAQIAGVFPFEVRKNEFGKPGMRTFFVANVAPFAAFFSLKNIFGFGVTTTETFAVAEVPRETEFQVFKSVEA